MPIGFPFLNPRSLLRTPSFVGAAEYDDGLEDGPSFAPIDLPKPTRPRPVPLAPSPSNPMDAPMPRPRMESEPLRDYRGNQISDPLGFRRDQFVRQGGQQGGKTDEGGKFKVGRSFKDIGLNALIGGLRGLSTGQGLGAGLGGALAGGLGATISPTRGRENLFNTTQAPMILAEQQRLREDEDRQRAIEMDDLRRRQIEAQTGMIEQQAADYPEERAARREDRALLSDERRARAEKLRQPPPPRPRNVVTDADGFLRDRDTMELLTDPGTGQPIKGRLPGSGSEAMPYSSSAQGIYDRRTGQVTTASPPRERQNTAAIRAGDALAKLKSEAEASWNKAKNFQPRPDQDDNQNATAKILLEQAARASQEKFNSAVQSVGEQYGDVYETGMGQGGWAYFKPRQGRASAPASGPQSGGGSGARLSDLKNKYLR